MHACTGLAEKNNVFVHRCGKVAEKNNVFVHACMGLAETQQPSCMRAAKLQEIPTAPCNKENIYKYKY